MNKEKTCLDCGNIIHGRADKKFCNDLCRNNYNNQLNSSTYNLVRNINNILRRNRRILEELNPSGKTKTTREKLLVKGFDFDYFTSIYQTQTGARYMFCYDYGYLLLDNDEILLVINKKETSRYNENAN